MKKILSLRRWLLLAALSLAAFTLQLRPASAQGTAFTYQGQLYDSGRPACGIYDLQFTLCDAVTNGNVIAGPLSHPSASVANGLFTVTLDFGPVFNGSNFWLQVAVRTNGGNSFTALNPLQELGPAPYAIYAASAATAALANSVAATNIAGAILPAQLPAGLVTNGGSGVQLTGTFIGNGAGLTNVNLTGGSGSSAWGSFVNVLQAGVVNDGVTDNTVALQRLLNQPGSALFFPPGRYLSQELQITNDVRLTGNGATLVYANGAANNNIFVREMLNTNIVIDGLAFDGQQYPNIQTLTWYGFNNSTVTNNAFTPALLACFLYWNPAGLRHGLQINIEQTGAIDNIAISGFSGIGLLPLSISGAAGFGMSKMGVGAVNIYSNLVGLYSVSPNNLLTYITNWQNNYVPGAQSPEYMHYSHMTIYNNTVGMDFSAANCVIENSTLSQNYIGALEVSTTGQSHHGIIQGVLFNHEYSIPFFASGNHQGEIIRDCYFAGDANLGIILDDCAGWTIEGCQLENAIGLTNSDSPYGGINTFRHNTYTGAWSSANVVTDGHLLLDDNYSYDTEWDPVGAGIAATGITNLGPRTATAVLTNLTGATFYVTNFYGLCVQTNNSVSGNFTILLRPFESINASGGLTGYIYW